MSFEKPQKGNPHQLTVRQHIHTAQSIGRFEAADGLVEVHRRSSCKTLRLARNNRFFCAERVWDERAEKGYMASIERAFHAEVANASAVGRDDRNHTAISKYHLLWGLRHQYSNNPLPAAVLVGVPRSDLTKDQEESLEAKGAGFVGKGGVLTSRFNNSLKIQERLDRHMAVYDGRKWGLLRAGDGEFLVADCYGHLAVMPIAPNLCFCGDAEDRTIARDEVAAINRASVAVATKFYFGRNLAACPIG